MVPEGTEAATAGTEEGVPAAPETPPTPDAPAVDYTQLSPHLSESLQKDETLSRFETPQALGNAYLELRKMDSSRVALPHADSGEDERSLFWNKLGKPASADGYELPLGEMPDEVKPTDETAAWFKQTAFERNLTADQANNLWQDYNALVAKGYEATTAQDEQDFKAAEEALQTEWGTSYETNVVTANETMGRLFSQEAIDQLSETGLTNNPTFIKELLRLNGMIAGDSVAGTTSPTTVAENKTVNEQIKELMDSPDYWKNSGTQDKVRKLFELQAKGSV